MKRTFTVDRGSPILSRAVQKKPHQEAGSAELAPLLCALRHFPFCDQHDDPKIWLRTRFLIRTSSLNVSAHPGAAGPWLLEGR